MGPFQCSNCRKCNSSRQRESRRSPGPWHAERIPGGYVVRDASGHALAYAYGRLEPIRSDAGKNPHDRRGAQDRRAVAAADQTLLREQVKDVLYDMGGNYQVMNRQCDGVVWGCNRYGLHSDRGVGRWNDVRLSCNRDVYLSVHHGPPLGPLGTSHRKTTSPTPSPK
jgi:hypothetical protein